MVRTTLRGEDHAREAPMRSQPLPVLHVAGAPQRQGHGRRLQEEVAQQLELTLRGAYSRAPRVRFKNLLKIRLFFWQCLCR